MGLDILRDLRGIKIPIEARITSLVDVYDALLSDRSYRGMWTKEEAVQYLKDNRGVIFDPEILDVFLINVEDFDAIRKNHPD